MNFHKIAAPLLAITAFATPVVLKADYPVNYEVEALFNAGSGELAPYYMSAMRHGILTQSKGALLRAGAYRPFESDKRFTYSFGAEFVTGATSRASYGIYHKETGWGTHKEGPAAIWLQQLYGELKYRSLFLSAGLKERESLITDFELSSGDVIESGNARPIAQVRAGFVDFQNIPFTNGWMQIRGELAYGKFFQNDYLRNHNNYSGSHYNLNTLYHYKRLYFRTKPSMPFSATFGAQFVCLFGGETYYFGNGVQTKVTVNRKNLRAFWQAFFPKDNGIEGYFEGQHLGSWDIAFRYRFSNGSTVRAYVQNLWEDGSGMGKLNGWDGLWGIEYKASSESWVSGAVVEYLDFTNQGGPTHWDPVDNPGTNFDNCQATGGDNYYNNGFYNSYANYGLAIGNPYSKQPIYNLDGSLDFVNSRFRGFHAAVNGKLAEQWGYRVMGGYRISYGTYGSPAMTPRKDTSFMLEGIFKPKNIAGLTIKGQFALDHGGLFGNHAAGLISVSYSGIFNFNRK